MFSKLVSVTLSAAIIWIVTAQPLVAQESDDSIRDVGETVGNPVNRTLAELLSTPGLMRSVPANDQPSGADRARLFFDIGRCYYALGDTVKAARVLRYAHALDPSLETGNIEVKGIEVDLARSFVAHLSLSQKRQKYAGTSKLKAAGRSLILPGWGQMYRGHKKRGLIALGATVVAGAFLAKTASDYNSAKDAYDRTAVAELNLEALSETSEIPRPFESRYQTYEGKANTANVAVVLDNLVLEPNRLALRWVWGR